MADGTENVPEAKRRNSIYRAFFLTIFNNNNLLRFDMKMQHTVYMETKHKKILDELMMNEGIGNGKQGTPNYNLAILKCIEAIDTAREAHFQALQKQCRLRAYFQCDERLWEKIEALRVQSPKKYQKIIDGKWRN